MLSEERLLVIEREKPDAPVILSLTNGAVLARPAFSADSAQPASNPRYALLHNSDKSGARLFDLQENHAVEVPPNLGLDVYGEEMALDTEEGNLSLHRLGEKQTQDTIRLPLVLTAHLRTVAVDPQLETLALSVDGQDAVFHVVNGNRAANAPMFSAAILSDSKSAILLSRQKGEARTLRLDTATGISAEAWPAGKETLHAGGTAFLEDAIPNQPFGIALSRIPSGLIPFRLRALDPVTGKELWKRRFHENPPLPFVDPQGDRLVLAWEAKSGGARAAAKQHARAWEQLRTSKPNQEDTLFEVLDARSGNSLGIVLVQTGGGAMSFESAFSEGDSLILVKDGIRVSLYSLRDGGLKARLDGEKPAANAPSALLALDEGNGLLTLYDLNSGAKRQAYHFPEDVAYTHFSGDGKRLLVLTQLQMAYLLDLSGLGNGQTSARP